jgi:hypothetical protein
MQSTTPIEILHTKKVLVHDKFEINLRLCVIPGCGGFLTGAARGAGRGADLPANTRTQ